MDPEPDQPSSTAADAAPAQPPSSPSQPDAQATSEGPDSAAGSMSRDADVDMKEVELNELEPEKQPMNAAAGAAGVAAAGGAEKNGLVKIKVADDEAEAAAAKFTGLTKEELLKVASSPGWVRTRWALLVLFWLGWFGMLAGAVVIIVQAPRCRELPVQRWWHKGALYRIGDVKAFLGGDAGNLEGLKGQLDYLNSLKVKGIVLGPLHKNPEDDFHQTNLNEVDPALGSKEDFEAFLQSAKKKSIRVVLDLTPNYRGQNSWFQPMDSDVVAIKVKDALNFWLNIGVDGFQVRDVEALKNAPSVLAEWQNITKSFSEDSLLIAGTNSSDLAQILHLLSVSNDVLLTSSYLAHPSHSGEQVQLLITQYLNATDNRWCSWSLSQAGLMTSILPASLLRLYHMLLFTIPGTPVFSYGDEIGLEAAVLPGQPMKAPVMLWNESSIPSAMGPVDPNKTVKGQSEAAGSLLSLFRRLSEQRTKERSLLHGDLHLLPAGPGLFAYVRQWDQNKRFLVLLNFRDTNQAVRLGGTRLPMGASLPTSVDLSFGTHEGRSEGSPLELNKLDMKPHEGLLFHFPYVA
ncbi:amino acid transporter heavy chain SLC3A2 isoform X2 [Sorex fumeus]|uniref:amino acid transporter heavy chain SLC3A2 isoform X2 n=1 Tax=Sorex fumeus TaxID=62283 RepID=UPI0024AD83DF|nr:amino acid transporter heavy chain SLC3A2 isoform X2 [Sorex fumeus]